MIQPQRFSLLHRYFYQKRLIDRAAATEGGFTISEVLVAILLTTTFVAVAMQGLVVAMLLKSKAVQVAEASQWVQTDLEQIRSKVRLSSIPLGANQSRCHSSNADVGFADLVRDNLAGANVVGSADYLLPNLVVTGRRGKTFQVARTLSIPSVVENNHFNILGVKYIVMPSNGTNLEQPIFHSYTEVMPDAALQCQ